ncbi:hypothetical protein ACFE04_000523 [Oxalis oulophora]
MENFGNNATGDQSSSSSSSNVSTAIEGASGFTMVLLLQLVQVESQNNGKSLFLNHPIHMIIFIISLFVYVTCLYLVKKQLVTNYLSLFEDICILSGMAGCDALLFIIFPPLGCIAVSFSILFFLGMLYVKYRCQICDGMLRLRGMRLPSPAGATGVDTVPISSTNHCFLGECIGTESCLDLKENLTFDDDVSVCRRKMAEVRDYPPPIPLLARTGNQSSHMPWVLKREYRKDGRLVLIEEKVKHHEYFKTKSSL